MAICAVILWLVRGYTRFSEEFSAVVGALSIVLVIASLMVRVRKLPEGKIELSPTLKLPSPIAFRGLDTNLESLTGWRLLGATENWVQVTTESRVVTIEKFWFSEEGWREFIDSLPTELRIEEAESRFSVSVVLFGYILLCFGTAYFLGTTGSDTAFKSTSLGAYNQTLALSGDLHRVLSYSWLHHNNMHLAINSFMLLLAATIIRNRFSAPSILALLIISTGLSAIIGSWFGSFVLLVGASGAALGVMGFLLTAGHYKDRRLSPVHTIDMKKVLVLSVVLEVVLSFVYSSYAGAAHLVGMFTGYGYYRLIESESARHLNRWLRPTQILVACIGATLFVSWLHTTISVQKEPYRFARGLLEHNDPNFTAIAGITLPGYQGALYEDIYLANKQAASALPHQTMNQWAIATTSFWLGDTPRALASIRRYAPSNKDLSEPTNLWFALEQAHATEQPNRLPIKELPAGTGTAWIISEDRQLIGRLELQQTPRSLASDYPKLANTTWYLNGITEPLTEPNYGIWRTPIQPLPTRYSGAVRDK